MKNVYQVIYQIVDETALYKVFSDAEEDLHAERFDCFECEGERDKIHISFTASSGKEKEVEEYWRKQTEWTLLDVFEEKVEYLPIKLLSFVTEPLELF